MATAPHNLTAADALAQIRRIRAEDADSQSQKLTQYLKHRSAPVIQAAAEGLGDLERLESVTPLMEAYESVESAGDKGCHTRITIVRALGQIGAATAEPIIRRALNAIQIETVGFGREDTALDLRAHAAFALTRVDPENAIHDLALMLFDSEPNVDVPFTERLFSKARTRMAAAKSIANLGYVSGAALLGVKLRFREHEVSEVLGDCLEAFISLDPPNVLEIVMPFLVGHDGFLAGMAATSLARFRGTDALDVLAESFDQIPQDAQVPTVLAITGIRSERTGHALMRFFDHQNPAIRLAAVQGAQLYRDNAIMARLSQIADSDPDPRVCAAAT